MGVGLSLDGVGGWYLVFMDILILLLFSRCEESEGAVYLK